MARKKRRTFEAGFKRQILAQIDSGQITLAHAARTHQLSPTVINYWRKQVENGAISDGPTAREKQMAKEIETLHAKIGKLTLEIDVLKKFDDWKREQKRLDSSVITGLNLPRSKKAVRK